MTLPPNTVAVFNEGCSVFTVDDHCYVLHNWSGKEWKPHAWLFREAVGILRGLPIHPDDAKAQMAEASSKLLAPVAGGGTSPDSSSATKS